jgi:hypothetical protein
MSKKLGHASPPAAWSAWTKPAFPVFSPKALGKPMGKSKPISV